MLTNPIKSKGWMLLDLKQCWILEIFWKFSRNKIPKMTTTWKLFPNFIKRKTLQK
jgi:hypothetical protein